MNSSVPFVDYTDTVRRPTWTDLPSGVQRAISQAAGGQVVAADAPPRSGFTGGFAAVVYLQDGRRVFAKAGSSVNPHLVAAYAQEAVVLAAMPDGVPAPRLIGAAHLPTGEADNHEWQVVVAQAVEGQLPQPWTPDVIRAAHDSCLEAAAALTPPPLDLQLPSLSTQVALAPDTVTCFDRLANRTLAVPEGQPPWLLRRCLELSALVASAAPAATGTTACHGDLRADNMLIGPQGATFVDWNWLMVGAAWIDFLGLLPLARADGVDVDAWLARSPLTRGVDGEAIDAWLATVAAYMLSCAHQPPWPNGSPLIRQHQRRYARTFLDWLAARRGWVTR